MRGRLYKNPIFPVEELLRLKYVCEKYREKANTRKLINSIDLTLKSYYLKTKSD